MGYFFLEDNTLAENINFNEILIKTMLAGTIITLSFTTEVVICLLELWKVIPLVITMERYVQHRRVIIEDMLNTIPVVYVPVHYQHLHK